MAAGLDVREVPPQLTARLRRRGRTQTKTDQVDALVVARVALRDHTLAGPTFWKDTEDLRLLVSYRRELVEHRTAQANRLHADLGKLRPGYHHNIPRLTTRKSLDQAMKLLWRDTTPHARIAKQRIRTLRQLDTQIKELTTEIAELVTQTRTRLLDIPASVCWSPPPSYPRSETQPATPPRPSSPWPTAPHPSKPAADE